MIKCVVCSHWEKQTLQGFPILKIVINLAWENVLSVHTEKNKHFKVILFRMGKPWSVCFSQCEQTFSHTRFITIFRMGKCVVCSHWGKQTLQGYPILKIVINLVWENVLSVHTEKNKHFKVIPF
jgi:hypothetical protein